LWKHPGLIEHRLTERKFLDRFIEGFDQDGGLDACRQLRSSVENYIRAELNLNANIPIRIRTYANVKGLASTYYHNKVLPSTDAFGKFLRDFNMCHPLCDYVDAGDGKECADAKLRGT
jgi:hypothetical protein